MLVSYAFNYKKHPEERGVWGNNSATDFLRDFPSFKSLVRELEDEGVWSQQSNNNRHDWTALFFVYRCAGEERVSLEIKAPVNSFFCPSMPLPKGKIPTMTDVMQFVLKNLRRR